MGVCLLFFTYMRYPLSQTWKVWIILTSFKQLACKGNPYLWDKASSFHIFVSFELIKISVAYICEVYCYFVVSFCKTYNPSYEWVRYNFVYSYCYILIWSISWEWKRNMFAVQLLAKPIKLKTVLNILFSISG